MSSAHTPTEALFARALIVEDLDEPRQWLAELLPRALPEVRQVDTAASLAHARERMADFAYGLALVDWGLPDGNSEELISELVAARPGAAVIVATIHDNDTHVFPALRAGATGYILKSQPSTVVVSQLQRIRLGEPALSPSIALRLLQHFRDLPDAAARPGSMGRPPPADAAADADEPQRQLTEREVDVLRLIGKGYKVPEAAGLLGISAHTVTSYVRDIYRKLDISSRAEAAVEAARRGLVS
ncbi:MAG: response regulator transcription factor [Rhodoferax sp.]|nr:response regulator transcription factor [Rhodoferax sp.]MCB2003680.1 response regulator transcription factor [Rhodoferax sp.]MCP5260907.1 response regulator transcription factor [Rhodoferax sp.]MCW5631513.1 response regulator transcription factor [Rhodoferax sp.]